MDDASRCVGEEQALRLLVEGMGSSDDSMNGVAFLLPSLMLKARLSQLGSTTLYDMRSMDDGSWTNGLVKRQES